MPRFCSVLGCGSNHARDKISFHRFPSIFNCNRQVDPLAKERRQKWIKALRRSDLTEKKIKYGFVCAKHFIKGAPAHLRDKDNPDWIPTQNMGYPTSTENDEQLLLTNQRIVHRKRPRMDRIMVSEAVDSVQVKSEQKNEMSLAMQMEQSLPKQMNQEGITALSNESILKKGLLKLPDIDFNDRPEFIKISDRICRLCLEDKPDMWLFYSVLTFEDQSTLDMVQVFQHLTGESTEQIENPRLPKHICKSCVDLLINAYSFRQKYEKSSHILTEFLSKQIEDDERTDTVSEPCLEDVRSVSYDDIMCKLEPEEENDGSRQYLDESNMESAEEMEENDEDSNLARVSLESQETSSENEGESLIKLHRCPICLKKFTALELKQHCRSHEALKKYMNAAPRFNKKVRFFASPRTNNTCLFYRENVSHVCPFCAEEFDGEQFKAHVKQHRTEGNFRCNICNRIFIGRNHLKMHQLYHKQETTFKCEECGKGFFQQKNFEFHKLTHTTSDDLPFKCQHCPRAFSNPEHLKRHSFNHEKFMSYQQYYKLSNTYVSCRQCLQKFKTKEELDEHSCRFCCAKCHKIFDRKKEFSGHVCKYRLKPSQCQPCGKVFQLSSSFKAHKYRCAHRTLCYVCGKNVSNITQHLMSHYPHRRGFFTCAHCGKQFRYKVNLNRHIAEVHLNITPFKCQYCPKDFKSKWNLIVHERIHLGVKEHICHICEKGFLEKSYLRKHLNAVHFRKDHFLAEDLKDKYIDDFWSQ